MNKPVIFLAAGTLLGLGLSQFLLSVSPLYSPRPEAGLVAESSPETSQSAISMNNNDQQETIFVQRVIDGDTIELKDGRRVRYIGINTAETVDPRRPVECFGKEASLANKNLVEGKQIRLEKDISQTDKYGRLLRYVYVGQVMVNDYLVRQGFASAATFPPDVKYAATFREAQREARENKRGLWSGCPADSSYASTASASGTSDTACLIKGNISTKGEKIYHLPACASYAKTAIDVSAGERWFCSEDEALKAGWRKAKNCN